MKSLFRVLLALGLVAVVLVSFVYAEEDGAIDAEEDYDAADDAAEMRQPFITRAVFPNPSTSALAPSLPAGSPATALIAYQNTDAGKDHQIVLLAAYLQPANTYDTILQNFSVVRQARTVKSSETITFRYTFTPDSSFEPGEYNLVVGVFWADTASNQTSFAPGFNATIHIAEATGADPRTILTYFTILAIVAAATYRLWLPIVSAMTAANRSQVKDTASRSGSPREVSTADGAQTYNPDYVSADHLRYREEILRQSSSSPSGRRASPKKKK